MLKQSGTSGGDGARPSDLSFGLAIFTGRAFPEGSSPLIRFGLILILASLFCQSLMAQTHSSTMQSGDLAAALGTLGEELDTAGSDQVCPAFHVEVEGTSRELKPILRDEFYRIAGEALRNAFRHAQARHGEVVLRYDDSQLILHVRDDGKGSARKFSRNRDE